MGGEILLLLLASATVIATGAEVPAAKNVAIATDSALPSSLCPFQKSWEWVNRTAGVIPDPCNFVYGGGFKRLLYVGRVHVGKDIVPAAIHHYGQGGSETAHYIQNGVVEKARNVEWLCGVGRVGWVRVEDFSAKTLITARAIPIGYNSAKKAISYGCIVHSFFSDAYPASLGTVVNGACEFEVNGNVVSSKDFEFWHTLELLVNA